MMKRTLRTLGILGALVVSVPMVVKSAAVRAADVDAVGQTQTVGADGIVRVTERLDMEMLKRHNNFGYTPDEIKKYFDYPQVFEYDLSGVAKDRLTPPPAPGIHPRVLFSPEELPALRVRLKNVKPAKMQMDGIRAMLKNDLTGDNAKYRAVYDAAARGEAKKEIREVFVACPIIYEAFRCLIDNDEIGGKKAAAALVTLAEADSATLDAAFAKSGMMPGPAGLRDYQNTMGITQVGLLGVGYDCAYNFMSDAQRDAVRKVIAKASAGMTFLGCETIPALPANSSNWITMHERLILLTLAIEGEAGYDPQSLHRAVEGYKRTLSLSLFPSGEMYESMGKGFFCAENLIPVARRGNNLLALKSVRSQMNNYYLHAMDPWGGHFTFFDSLGGRGNNTPKTDLVAIKYMFPSDPAIDFVYRNTVGEEYQAYSGKVGFGHFFHLGDAMIRAVYGQEYDSTKTFDQARAAATAGKSLTYFSDDTCNLITQTAWADDALQFHFLTRAVSGGHQYADRGHFSIHALGRYWAIYKPLRQVEEHYAPQNRSVLLIDGKGPGMSPGRCIGFQDNAAATFIASDFKTTYEWDTGGNNRFPKGGQRVPFSGNFFRLNKSDRPWMDISWSDLPHWQTSMKGAENWVRHLPVQRAFRSGGLVRGSHPYVLITDDIQQDNASHEYVWNMILEDDLVQDSVAAGSENGAFRQDIIIGEKSRKGADARFMLVRILDADGLSPKAPATVETYSMINPPQKDIVMNHLAITAKTVAPDFKVLLFPYRSGQAQPTTNWNADRTVLQLYWSDQKDTVTYTKGADGRTRIGIVRDGKSIMAL